MVESLRLLDWNNDKAPGYSPQTLDQEVRIPGEFRAKTIGTSARPLPQPVDNALESVLGIRGPGVEPSAVLVLDIVVGDGPPRILTVVKVPLVHKGDGARAC